jgi:uncharacterized membrane protein
VRRALSLAAIGLVMVMWSAALIAAPRDGSPRLSAMTYAAGSLICHQRPDRSFHYHGAQYPVCARCLGLYLGSVAGVLLWAGLAGVGARPKPRAHWLTIRRARALLIGIGVPTIASVGTGMLGLWDANNIVRAVLAWPLGATIAAVSAAVAAGDLR